MRDTRQNLNRRRWRVSDRTRSPTLNAAYLEASPAPLMRFGMALADAAWAQAWCALLVSELARRKRREIRQAAERLKALQFHKQQTVSLLRHVKPFFETQSSGWKRGCDLR